MKTTKKRLLNIIVASSIAINLVMLAALAYIATIDNHTDRLSESMKSPVFIYVPKIAESSAAAALGLSSSK